ncbi:hypothetical protein D3C85_1605600 [compost metagenome]
MRFQFDVFIQFIREHWLLLPCRDPKNDIENDTDHDMRKDGNQSQYEDKRAPIVKDFRWLHSFHRIPDILARAKRYENEDGAND